ncbi:hypothetical protein PMAYCL1PPCAC_31680, partial [Pristionchus mayeri]
FSTSFYDSYLTVRVVIGNFKILAFNTRISQGPILLSVNESPSDCVSTGAIQANTNFCYNDDTARYVVVCGQGVSGKFCGIQDKIESMCEEKFKTQLSDVALDNNIIT